MMKVRQVLRFAENEFIYGGHLVGVGAMSMVFTASMMMDIIITWDFLVIAYLVAYIAYAYNKLKELKLDAITNPSRTEHVKKYINYLPVIIACDLFAILLLLMTFGNADSILIMTVMVIGSILYTEYFKGITKKIPGFKTFYVSFFWALLIILLAFYYNYSFFDLSIYYVTLFLFLRCMVNLVFFDIKDIDSDKISGLKTVPIVLGREYVFIFMHILNVISFAPLVCGVCAGVLPVFSLALLVFYFYSFYYLELAKRKTKDIQKISYVMADGEYALWTIVIILSSVLTGGK